MTIQNRLENQICFPCPLRGGENCEAMIKAAIEFYDSEKMHPPAVDDNTLEALTAEKILARTAYEGIYFWEAKKVVECVQRQLDGDCTVI